jgi:hypothetical protein
MERMKKAISKKTVRSELEKQYSRLFTPAENTDPIATLVQPYPSYPSPMRVVQTVTTYSACEDPIPNPYKRT